MNETGDKDTGSPGFDAGGGVTSGGSFGPRHFIVIVVVAIVIGAAFYMWHRSTRAPSVPERPEGVTVVPEGSRTVTLYFADKDAETLVTETRLVAVGRDFVEQVAQVVRALIEGPRGSGVSTIAEGTQLLNAYYDSETGTVYLDFTSELVAGHPGGSSAEYYTIAALVRTISENFPEVQAVQVLVEGLQVGTIAGHIDAYRPFMVRDWR